MLGSFIFFMKSSGGKVSDGNDNWGDLLTFCSFDGGFIPNFFYENIFRANGRGGQHLCTW